MKTVAFHTLGCKVNQYESEAMMDLFKKAGYEIVDFAERADVYVVNSCTVTNEAARKSRQLARRAKRENPLATVAVVGCYTQVSPEEVQKINGVDLVIGTARRGDIVKLVEEVMAGRKPSVDILKWKELTDFEELKVNEFRETTRAYIKIEEGCNQFCSYCIIPYARGPVRSRDIESVVQEVKNLVAQGVREIILTGTHLGAYGYDWDDDESLVKLLQKLAVIEGLGHIRLSSIEVTEVTDSLLKLISSEEKLCPHLHLPLQSGSDKILRKMRRPYTTADFREVVEDIRRKIPDPALTTDVIVGFPGEEEEYFQESYNFIKEIGFSRLHVFPFSPREGTPAARMKGQIPGDIKKRYSKKLRDLNKELMLAYQRRHLGQVREAIIEERRDQETGLLTGMTDNYIRVLIDDDDSYQGRLVKVELTATHNYENALGKIIYSKQEF